MQAVTLVQDQLETAILGRRRYRRGEFVEESHRFEPR